MQQIKDPDQPISPKKLAKAGVIAFIALGLAALTVVAAYKERAGLINDRTKDALTQPSPEPDGFLSTNSFPAVRDALIPFAVEPSRGFSNNSITFSKGPQPEPVRGNSLSSRELTPKELENAVQPAGVE